MFSIIILNWNGRKWIEKCIDSILGQSCGEYEIIFVDNGSSDDSVQYVRKRYPAATIIENGQNYGYARGNNIGAGAAKSDILFFLNTDTIMKEDCLSRLKSSVRGGAPDAGIYALKLFSYDGASDLYPDDRWMGVDFLGYPCLSKKLFYADGAAMAVKRDLFEKLNGFDQAHFMFAEDVDLCWRARLLGYRVIGVSGGGVCHSVGGSGFDRARDDNTHITSLRKRYLAERNTIRNMLKNYSVPVLLFALPALFLSYVVESIICLLLLRPDMIVSVYAKAILYNVCMFGDTMRERKRVQRSRAVSDIAVLREMSFKLSKYDLFARTRLKDFVVKIEK